MKKAILSVLSALSTSIFLSSTVFATTNLGTLSYWESDSNTIRRWNERSINIYCEKLNSNNSFTFLVGIDHGCEQWDDVPGITLSSSANDSYSSAPIQIHGGTMEQVNSYGEFTVTSSHNGITRSFSVPEGTWTYGSISKTGELTNRVVACIIDKDHTPDK